MCVCVCVWLIGKTSYICSDVPWRLYLQKRKKIIIRTLILPL